MHNFDWDEEKNNWLKITRGITFEEVTSAIDNNQMLDDFDHPNQNKYPKQRIMIVEITEYAYVVPYIQSEGKIFLKTIIPSRKATKKYIIKEKI